MLYGYGNIESKIEIKFIKSIGIHMMFFSFVFIYFTFFQILNGFAIPKSMPRIAVLEMQGEIGSIKQRQAWTDTMRASALDTIRGYDLLLIDREQFNVLIDPSRDLSDCTDLCAVEIARELSAHWAISSTLTLDLSPKAKQGEFKKEDSWVLLTLKLHSSKGNLLGIEQLRGRLSQVMQAQLQEHTRLLIERDLFGMSKQPLTPVVQSTNQGSTFNPKPNERPKDKGNEQAYLLIHTKQNMNCITPLVTMGQYQECVQHGSCSSLPTWGQCRAESIDPVRCINLKQALEYSRWKKAELPSKLELNQLLRKNRSVSSFFEWLEPEDAQAFMKLDDHKIKKFAKQQTLKAQASHGQSVLVITKAFPPSFQTRTLSFRLRSQDLKLCQSE